MTNRRKSGGQDMNLLKTLLVVGSIGATLAGTRLLAVKDAAAETTAAAQEQVIIIEPAPTSEPFPMPPNSSSNQAIVLDLAPVPQAVTPNINPVQVQQVRPAPQVQPVAKTKTS